MKISIQQLREIYPHGIEHITGYDMWKDGGEWDRIVSVLRGIYGWTEQADGYADDAILLTFENGSRYEAEHIGNGSGEIIIVDDSGEILVPIEDHPLLKSVYLVCDIKEYDSGIKEYDCGIVDLSKGWRLDAFYSHNEWERVVRWVNVNVPATEPANE